MSVSVSVSVSVSADAKCMTKRLLTLTLTLMLMQNLLIQPETAATRMEVVVTQVIVRVLSLR